MLKNAAAVRSCTGRQNAAHRRRRTQLDRGGAVSIRRRKAQAPSRHARGPEVRFENQVSDKFTVIDTDVADDVGLLYRITRALGELDLDIHMAIVNTVVSQAQDAFYVVDAHGEKIVNYEVFEQIRERLLADLAT